MMGSIQKYGFINAKLRTRLSKILSEETLDQMIKAPSLQEAIHFLKDTSYGDIETIYNKTGDLKMAEMALFKKEINLYSEVEKYVKGSAADLLRALVRKFEVDVLKNIMRLWFDRHIRGRDIEDHMIYLFRDPIHYDLKADILIQAGTLEEAAEILNKTPYAPVIRQNADKVLSQKSIFPLELALDHLYYRELLEAIDKLPSWDKKIASRFIGAEIDLQNINWLARFKLAYDLKQEEALEYAIPRGFNISKETFAQAYNSEDVTEVLTGLIDRKYPGLRTLLNRPGGDMNSRLLLIERLLHQIMLQEIQKVLMGHPFTIGIILAYLVLKRNEIKKIMTILNAKYYGIKEERIKSGL